MIFYESIVAFLIAYYLICKKVESLFKSKQKLIFLFHLIFCLNFKRNKKLKFSIFTVNYKKKYKNKSFLIELVIITFFKCNNSVKVYFGEFN
jgi:hypothetical protein